MQKRIIANTFISIPANIKIETCTFAGGNGGSENTELFFKLIYYWPYPYK